MPPHHHQVAEEKHWQVGASTSPPEQRAASGRLSAVPQFPQRGQDRAGCLGPRADRGQNVGLREGLWDTSTAAWRKPSFTLAPPGKGGLSSDPGLTPQPSTLPSPPGVRLQPESALLGGVQ